MDFTSPVIKKTETREELVELCAAFSEAVEGLLKKRGHERPVVIFINGDAHAGKSLIWDELRANLLGSNCAQVKASHNRTLERWKGFSERLNSDLRLFAANLKGTFKKTQLIQMINFFNQMLEYPEKIEEMRGQLGDVIIINNVDYVNGDEELPDMVFKPDYVVSLEKQHKLSFTSWERSISIRPIL